MSEAERGIIPGTAAGPPAQGRLLPLGLETIPWWALLLLLAGLLITLGISTSPVYKETLAFLWSGVLLTLRLSVSAYVLALLFGLVAGLMRVSKQPVLYTMSTLYVEVIRGVPLLVLLIYIAFVAAPLVSEASARLLNAAGLPSAADLVRGMVRNDMNRAILGLAVGYGAYLAEIYRAGIEAVPRGQMEAARSLGMTYWQAMRHIILPQAVRVILPPLGNDFIAMLKDSALASAIAVPELTQTGRLLTARTFRALQTYNMVALLYLAMTLIGSMGVRALERWAAKGKH